MHNFPEFMRNPKNKIDPGSQFTPGIEGYVFDGADGSQLAFWTRQASPDVQISAEHVHDYDEYFVVVEGEYTVIIDGSRTTLHKGDEFHIPKGVVHSGEMKSATRTIHAFGGKRAKRAGEVY
jgi:ethanolamine utilization protein EutQ (cupin superfamily)